ncbi:hypothetical protein OC834_004625 [Tilletia horrida]|nr:hypothetical protein OC834_004625 [Tilletia horrida]
MHPGPSAFFRPLPPAFWNHRRILARATLTAVTTTRTSTRRRTNIDRAAGFKAKANAAAAATTAKANAATAARMNSATAAKPDREVRTAMTIPDPMPTVISHAKARRILGFAQQGGKASSWFNRYSRWMARTGKSLPDDPSIATGSSKLTHRNRLVALHWARLKRNRAEKRNTTLAIRKWEREHRANITVQAAQTALNDLSRKMWTLIHEAEKFHGIISFAAAAHPFASDAKDSRQLFKNFASQVNVKVKFKDEEEDQIETLISSMSFSVALTGANLDAGIAAVPARGQMPVLAKPLMMFAGVMPRSRAPPYRLKDVT